MTRGKQIIEEAKRIIAEAHERGNNDPMVDLVITLSFSLGARWADKNPAWVSVHDELPKDGQSCIILIDRKALQGMPRTRSAVYAPNVMLQQEGFVYNRMSKKHHITHWMPLPQPPKKGE